MLLKDTRVEKNHNVTATLSINFDRVLKDYLTFSTIYELFFLNHFFYIKGQDIFCVIIYGLSDIFRKLTSMSHEGRNVCFSSRIVSKCPGYYLPS